MRRLVVVENPARWPLEMPGVEAVSARAYLTDPQFAELRSAIVFNLCRSYAYQGLGYYVSLLAAARGHRPLPSVSTLQDLRMPPLVRIVSQDLDELIQRSLRRLRSQRFELSIYFGANLAGRYERLSSALFGQFPAPFLRATFVHEKRWRLQSIRPIATSEIPESHREFAIERAQEYLARPRRARSGEAFRYDLAILRDPDDESAPSDDAAIRRFVRAARRLGMDATTITRDDGGRIAEFDALFIRETTAVEHHTYRIARRAAAEGIVVVDDPESIVRCTNKVFQAELFERHDIAAPPTMVVHAGNADRVIDLLGLPCVLKQPDSAFSQGVVKATTEEELGEALARFFEHSELVVAQRFVRSDFDWRIGVLGGKPLYAARYHMARGHWQIVASDGGGRRRYGRVEAVPLRRAPRRALELARRAASFVGDGFYGVDVKPVPGGFAVIEINDNPNVDAGCEDGVLGDELYLAVMRWFRDRLDARGRERAT